MKRANYRAPREHRVALIVPRPAQLPQVVEANRELLASYDFHILGRPVQPLRESARRSLLVIPYNCTLNARLGGGRIDPSSIIILTGHQPALYHPGVWLKNFLAGHLVQAIGGVAINLNVDNDEAHQLTIKAPVIKDGRVSVVEAAYLQPTGGLPYEDLGEELLKDGVADELRQLGVAAPLCEAVQDYWYRLDGARGRKSYARVVTCARHQLERQAGLDNLETLVSDMARLAQFRCFMLDVLANLERFHEAYNGGLRMFREVHHETNPAQPVPNLGRDVPRWEMPFWVWRTGSVRQRLWAERRDDRFLLFIDGQDGPFVEIERRLLADGGRAAIDRLNEAEAQGVKVRPRALTLTLFARLFLGDLFIHGLGGAIYDKVTEEIIRSYYGVEPAQAVMATGTMLLPLESLQASEMDRLKLLRRLRDVKHNPHRLMDVRARSDPAASMLIEERRSLIQPRGKTSTERSTAWHRLREVNRMLAGRIDGEPQTTRRRLRDVEDKLAQNALLKNREYTFALHPRSELIDFYREVTTVPKGCIR